MQLLYANVFVRDLEVAIAFYRDTLGLEFQHGAAEHGYASFSAGPIGLGLAVAGPEQGELVGRHTGLGFMVADLDAEHARLSALGVHFEMPPSRQPWGGYMSLFTDPDENIYYLDQLGEVH